MNQITKKPLIGLTSWDRSDNNSVYTSLNTNYSNSITRAGGIPLLIPNVEDFFVRNFKAISANDQTSPQQIASGILGEYANSFVEKLDGIIFTGGNDVCPYLYGEEPLSELKTFSFERDSWEIALFFAAVAKNIPIMGICRGCQLINVASGGSLIQDTKVQKKESHGHSFSSKMDQLIHSIDILPDSRLAKITGKNKLLVNSFHHQAIKELGKELIVSASAKDSVVEAIESTNSNKWLLAVQYHPEALSEKYTEFQQLFSAFVKAC